VYVSGAVAHPGVYALPWDSRVEQAVAAAGGGTADADLLRVNLAQRVHDEQQIYVPHKSEAVTPVLPTPVPPTPIAGTSSIPGQKVNINTASAAELEALPGIGPVLAQRIIDYRQTNGPFRTPEDMKRVKGIGDVTFERLRDLITAE
jgi:competence protein ComEA